MSGARSPVVAAWGAGANSTAMIVELVRRGEPLDAVLLVAMPEQPHTRALIPLFRDWMDAHGVPNDVVEYKVTHCKHWPPYNDLLEACLTNGTLPSIAFGLHSCSARHNISPQDKWVKAWPPAQHAWAHGRKVTRLIGYDRSSRDNQRHAHREGHVSDLYDYRYPLREWGWDRDDCDACIADAGLPPFPKSSCFFLCLHKASRLTASSCFLATKKYAALETIPDHRSARNRGKAPLHFAPVSSVTAKGGIAPCRRNGIVCDITPNRRVRFRPDPAVHIRFDERPVLMKAADWADRSGRCATRQIVAVAEFRDAP